MLSDFRNDKSKFGVSLGYGTTKSGDSTYDSFSLNVRVKPTRWLQFTASLPYASVDASDKIRDMYDIDNDGNLDPRTRELKYSNDGAGDLVLMGWVNALYPLFNAGEKPVEADPDAAYKALSDIGDPALFVGLGVKLPTGAEDAFDQGKYVIDRESSDSTILSKSDGILPTRFQMGTGTTDPLFGMVYQQSLGRFQPSIGVSYQISGGENSVGYERSDRFGVNASLKYTAYSSDDCSKQFHLSGGVSWVNSLDDDYDHSLDPKIFKDGAANPRYGLEKGTVHGSKGSYTFYSIGLGYDISRSLSVNASLTLPLSGSDEESTYSFDRSFGLSLSARF
ncbi:MAG: hypothetical protein ABIK28_23915 [Planctomycetota bacterium]